MSIARRSDTTINQVTCTSRHSRVIVASPCSRTIERDCGSSTSLAKARVTHAFHLWAWVIMPEHVHLLIWPRLPEYEMSHILSSIKQPVGTKAIQYLQRHAARCLKELTLVNRNRTYHRFWQCGSGYDQHTAAHARSAKCVTGPQRTGALLKRPVPCASNELPGPRGNGWNAVTFEQWHDVKP